MDFQVRADRWIRRRRSDDSDDPPFDLDETGLLAEGAEEAGGWVRPDAAAKHGGWVLLGEPGGGKTTTFTAVLPGGESVEPPLPGSGGTVWVDGADLQDRTTVEERLGAYFDCLPLKSASTGTTPPQPLLIVIDQLDESDYRIQLARWLDKRLKVRDTSSLRIWIACRTADFPDDLGEVLANRLGSCVVGDLAPLGQPDVELLVNSTGTDVIAFFEEVRRNSLGPFASIPLTLRVLLTAYRETPSELTTGPRRFFERCILDLSSEPDHQRAQSDALTSTVEQRMAVAARIATHLILCGRRWVHTSVHPQLSDTALPFGEMVGAQEAAGAGEFEVTKKHVQETLATALFTGNGAGRVAFAHSSFAAFLTARYLAERITAPAPMPQQQLKSLLLVAAPDESSAAIPRHLAETAAWLLAHAPTETRWLAEADPEALTAHSGIITDPDIRSAIVTGLLARADRIELAGRGWRRARWYLDHPGLGPQLVAAISELRDDSLEQWPSHAKARLAVRLAGDSGLAELAGPLAQVVANERWPVVLRRYAARTAVRLDANQDAVIEPLRQVLAGFTTLTTPVDNAEDQQESSEDTVFELVGTLLHLLWPEHLSFTEAAPHIRPGLGLDLGSIYRSQVLDFPTDVSDDDVSLLIDLAEERLRDAGIVVDEPDPEAMWEDDDSASAVVGSGRPALERDKMRSSRDFVLAVVARVLISPPPPPAPLVSRAARMILWFLSGSERLQLPLPVDLVDRASGIEPDAVRDVRRSFTESLLTAAHRASAADRDYWVYVVLHRWGHSSWYSDSTIRDGMRRGQRHGLLDTGDSAWAFRRAQHYASIGDTALTTTFEQIAIAYAPSPSPQPQPQAAAVWEDAGTFAANQRERLDAAAAGDGTSFWHLVKYLRINPATGHYEPVSSWRITDFAGAALWEPHALRTRGRVAALQYLRTETENRETWLGATFNWGAEAAMVAFDTIWNGNNTADGQPRGLDEIPPERWSHWVGAILDGIERFDSGDDLDRQLLEHAARYAPTDLADAVRQVVRTRVIHSDTSTRLPELPPSLAGVLRDLAVEIRQAMCASEQEANSQESIEASPRTAISALEHIPGIDSRNPSALAGFWSSLLHLPLSLDDAVTVELARNVLNEGADNERQSLGFHMAVMAGQALLTADATTHWDAVHSQVETSAEFAKTLALRCALSDHHHQITGVLAETELAQLYRWLATACPPETEIYGPGFTAITAEHEVHHWRPRVAEALTRRGTIEAVHALRDLQSTYPNQLGLQAALDECRRTYQTNAAKVLTSTELNAVLNDQTRRVVRTARQLADVIMETLDNIATDLHTHGNLLWNCERGTKSPNAAKNTPRPRVWRPKPVGELGAYLAHELDLRLVKARVIVNREVMVSPTDHGDSGERPDLKVDVATPADNTGDRQRLTVPIEIKGSWHEHVLTAQTTQLANRYLSDLDTTDGVYVIGWYPLEQWNTPLSDDKRKSAAKKHESANALMSKLQNESTGIFADKGMRTHVCVLTIDRAVPANKREARAHRSSRARV